MIVVGYTIIEYQTNISTCYKITNATTTKTATTLIRSITRSIISMVITSFTAIRVYAIKKKGA